jgi:hypothetical protein
MSYSIKSKAWASIIAILISGLFLWLVLNPPSVFNLLPFAIHEAINPGGSSEQTFIIVFDLAVALLLFIFLYQIMHKQLIKR